MPDVEKVGLSAGVVELGDHRDAGGGLAHRGQAAYVEVAVGDDVAAALEVATVASLPPHVAASDVAGGADMRLRIPHRITHVTLHHTGSAEPTKCGPDQTGRMA